MSGNYIFRVSQLLLLVPCLLREWINFLTDVGQYQTVVNLIYKVISFPTQDKVNTLFNRAFNSLLLAKITAIGWVIIHFTSALLITIGLIILVKNLKANTQVYSRNKLVAIFGLSFSFASYIMLIGFFQMDFFLSWMNGMNGNNDLIGYSLPLAVALIFLALNDQRA